MSIVDSLDGFILSDTCSKKFISDSVVDSFDSKYSIKHTSPCLVWISVSPPF
jgi:hypothetical protein